MEREIYTKHLLMYNKCIERNIMINHELLLKLKVFLFLLLVNDTGIGSDHFVSSAPSSSQNQPDHVEGVLASPQIPHHGSHHIHVQGQQDQQHVTSSQVNHINSNLQHLASSSGQIVSSVPAVSVVVNDEDGLLPLEPLSNSDYSYALDEQEDLNELFDSFPF